MHALSAGREADVTVQTLLVESHHDEALCKTRREHTRAGTQRNDAGVCDHGTH